MPKHTPGPWKIVADPKCAGMHPYHDNRYIMTGGSELEFGYDDRGDFAVVNGSWICTMRDTEPANARLIASAPDMLSVLKDVADFWSGGDCPPELWDRINAAINKAEGGE